MATGAAATSTEPTEWTSIGFVDEFEAVHRTMADRPFMFVLGAGASVSSGIAAGGTLARQWVQEIYLQRVGRNCPPSFEEWANPVNLGIPEFSLESVAEFYQEVYQKRFANDRERGYAYLENAMGGAKPNVGYSILSQILEKTPHKVVITTNFDNLVADALSTYSDTFPLVCGHESLAGFARPRLRRPLVAKIHRDLLLEPRTDRAGTTELADPWVESLRCLLREYTPIVIGYGGDDGRIMGILHGIKPRANHDRDYCG